MSTHRLLYIRKLIQKYLGRVSNKDCFLRTETTIGGIKHVRYHNSKQFVECDAQQKHIFFGKYISNYFAAIYRWKFRLSANNSYFYVDADNKCKDALLRNVSIGLFDQDEKRRNWRLTLSDSSRFGYCRPFRSGDIVTMEVNYIYKTLSFAINDLWYGCFATINFRRYKTVISVKYQGVTVENVDLDVLVKGKDNRYVRMRKVVI